MPKNRKSPEVAAQPAQPNKQEGQVGFFERVQQFSPEGWHDLKVYVYRKWPVIHRKDTAHLLGEQAAGPHHAGGDGLDLQPRALQR